jgi:hypothetical protein
MSSRDHINDIRTFGLSYWLRDRLRFTWVYYLWYDHVKPVFWPKHSELRAAIPRTWVDIDTCIENVLYAAVISYVEREKGLETWEHQGHEHPARKEASMLKEVYLWARTDRAIALKEIDAAYPPIKDLDFTTVTRASYTQSYGEVDRLQGLFDEKEDKYLAWVVANRRLMWS